MTARSDAKLQDPERDHPPSEGGSSGARRRGVWPGRIGLFVAGLLVWPAWSITGALTAPGADSTAARLAEWGRANGLGWAVTALEKAQYDLHPPKVGGILAGGIPSISARPSASPVAGPAPIPPQAQPPLPEEGLWQPLVSLKGQPAIRAAFLRPDAQHTSFMVGVTWINQKLVKLVLHPGFKVPGGSGWSQPFEVPTSRRSQLLATFNSGFTIPDSTGGYWQDGQSAAPLRQGKASMVFYKDGHVDVVKWHGSTGSAGDSPGPDVTAVRQNLGLLVDNGTITPDVDSTTTGTWGWTIGNKTFVWRSALGVRKDGSLVFVVGASMSVRTLANIVHAAGAQRALELDINPQWTNFITYTHPSKNVAVPRMLTRDEKPNPYRYLQPSSRDFVAVLAR